MTAYRIKLAGGSEVPFVGTHEEGRRQAHFYGGSLHFADDGDAYNHGFTAGIGESERRSSRDRLIDIVVSGFCGFAVASLILSVLYGLG